MSYNFDTIPNRRGTNCEKYDYLNEIFGRDDLIPLWIADMDFEAMPELREAIIQRANHPVYGSGFRGDEYHNAIIGWIERHAGWRVRREWIEFTPGVVSGFTFAMRALTQVGDGVLIQTPVYHPFARMINANNRRVVCNQLKLLNSRYEIDFEDMDSKLAECKVFVLCSPHNPVGRVFTPEELLRMGELCRKHNVVIVSDEIHADLVFPNVKHTHIAQLSDDLANRTITLIAPSKTFNVAGLSTSVVIIPNDTLRRRFFVEFNKIHIDQGNIFGTVALTTAYTYGDKWLKECMEYVKGNYEFVKEFLAKHIPSVKVCEMEATYLL